MWVPYVWDPKAPTQEEIHGPNSLDLSPWLTEEPPDDVGDPPAGWCPKPCGCCGGPCGEFVGHRGQCSCS